MEETIDCAVDCRAGCDCDTDNDERCLCDEPELVKGDPFCYHRVTEDCSEEMREVRAEFRFLRDLIAGTDDCEQAVPDCRERSLCLTHLQTAMMFAIAAMAINHPDSEPVS